MFLQASFSQKSQTQQTDDLDGSQTFHFAGLVILVISAPCSDVVTSAAMMPLPGQPIFSEVGTLISPVHN